MVKRENFLEPETRWNFEVTVERKRLWRRLLNMLEVVAEICERHGIPYFLDGGSTLGAARHQGIIPWDDDIDVVLLRPDYNRLEQVLKKELPSRYFLQTSATDPQYTITHMKVRDSEASALLMCHVKAHRVYNMGVFLDIFALDGVPENPQAQARQLRHMHWMKAVHELSLRKNTGSLKSRLASSLCRSALKLFGHDRFYRWREAISSKYPAEQSETLVSGFGEFGYKYLRKREWFKDVRKMPFEYLTCNVPIGLDAYLLNMFGDWKKPVMGSGNHGETVFDMNKGYKTKLIEEYGYSASDFGEV